MDSVSKKFRQRYWTLRNLKLKGFSDKELTQVYKTMIRPMAEYGCVAFHSSYTDEQDEHIEKLQNHALKCIYGPGISARKIRSLSGLQILRARRIELADKFAKKCSSNPRFQQWFPLKDCRSSRRLKNREIYREDKTRCNRLVNSPVYYFRRRLNGKEGKNYGSRYKEYREDNERVDR